MATTKSDNNISSSFTTSCPDDAQIPIRNVLEGLVDFQNTREIERIENIAFRYGRTSDIETVITTDDENDDDEYIRGLLGTAITILVFIIIWMFIILVLKFLGYKRVGIFSGNTNAQKKKDKDKDDTLSKQHQKHDVVVEEEEQVEESAAVIIAEEEADNDGQQHERPLVSDGATCIDEEEKEAEEETAHDDDVLLSAGKKENDEGGGEEKRMQTTMESNSSAVVVAQKNTEEDSNKQQNMNGENESAIMYLKISRIMVLLCGIGIDICVIIIIAKGIDEIVNANDNAIDGLQKGRNLAISGIGLIDTYVQRQDTAASTVRNFTQYAGVFCPGLRNEICSNNAVNNATACEDAVADYRTQLKSILNNTGSYILDELQSVRDNLVDLEKDLEGMEEGANSFDWAFEVAALFNVILALVTVVIMYDVVALLWRTSKTTTSSSSDWNCWQKMFRFMRHWLFVPVFCILVLICWILCMVFVTGSIASADLCLDSPDSKFELYLDVNKDKYDGLIAAFLRFYIGGCQGDGPLGFRDTLEEVLAFGEKILAFSITVQSFDPDLLSDFCGADPGPLLATAVGVEKALCLVGTTVRDVQEYFSCPNWRPLYQIVAYDAVCTDGNEGFYWIAVTQFAIVIFAMVMLTLRVAFTENEQPVTSPSEQTISKPNPTDKHLDESEVHTENQQPVTRPSEQTISMPNPTDKHQDDSEAHA